MSKLRIKPLLLFIIIITINLKAKEASKAQFFVWKIQKLKTIIYAPLPEAPASILLKTSANCNISIPSSGSINHVVTSIITVTESGTIQDLNVNDLDITHTYIEDLWIKLISPQGTEATLIGGKCGSNQNLLLGFDDEASTSTVPCPPTNGNAYQPQSALSIFDGEEINGNWTIRVEDTYPWLDGGTLKCWSIEFDLQTTTNNCPNTLTNSEFDNGSTDWLLYPHPNNSATLNIDNASQLSGTNAARIDNIVTETGTDWNIQFGQSGKSVEFSKNYTISFQGKSTTNRNMNVMLQLGIYPWTLYFSQNVALTSSSTNYSFSFTAANTSTNNINFLFNVGESSQTVWIDNVFFGETCAASEICDNGIDDDGDGLIDDLDDYCISFSSCQGSEGENVFSVNEFGLITDGTHVNQPNATNNPGVVLGNELPIGATNYSYGLNGTLGSLTGDGSFPDDGYYVIANNTGGMIRTPNPNLAWWDYIEDNGPESNGYMMIVNASYEPGIFYQETITGLCPNTTYEFSTDVINLWKTQYKPYGSDDAFFGPPIVPNLAFVIAPSGISATDLANYPVAYKTGDIINDANWHSHGFTFTTGPNTIDLVLAMRNYAPGGEGNDIAIDNLVFKACGPDLSISSVNNNICQGESLTINGVLENGYTNPVFSMAD